MRQLKNLSAFAILLAAGCAAAGIPTRDNLLGPVRTVTTSSGVTFTVDETPATFKITVPATSAVIPAAGPSVEAPEAAEETPEVETDEEPGAAESEPALGELGARLFPSFADAAESAAGTPLVSLDMCGYRYQQFGYCAGAAVEVKLEDGLGVLEAGKQRFLIDLLARVKTIYDDTSGDAHTYAGDTMVFLVVAIMLGRADENLPPEVLVPGEMLEKARERKEAYLEQYPYKFYVTAPYTWREDLTRVMARDRWLSRALEPGDRDYHSLEKSMVLTEALTSDPELLEKHKFIWELYGALVGKGHGFSVEAMAGVMAGDDYATIMSDPGKRFLEVKRDAIALEVPFRLLPEARSLEIFLVDLVVADRKKVSYGTFENIVRSVSAGEVKLEPEAGASWRAFEAYALDALIRPDGAPEIDKISMDDAYRSRLVSRLMYSIVQEPSGTTSLGADRSAGGLGPAFTVEPVPSYYLYLARSCGSLDSALAGYLGKAYGEVHGFRAGGAVTPTLDGEMERIRELFYGLYLESCYNLGMKPALRPGEVRDPKAAVERARDFAGGWANDPDFSADIRRLIPIAPSKTFEGADGVNCFAVLGVRAVEITVEYDTPPKVSGGEPIIGSTSYTILVPVVVEVVIPGKRVMPHEEFIGLCDMYKRVDELTAAVEKRPVGPEKEAETEEKASVWVRLDAGTKVLLVVLGVFVIIVVVILVKKRV